MSTIPIQLTKTTLADLPTLYQFQLSKDAIQMAAFTPKDPISEEAYVEKHSRFLSDPTINNYTIHFNGVIVGSIAKFEMYEEAQITYWIDQAYWGQGIASAALQAFLKIETTRPIYAGAAFDNIGSQQVLLKAGFVHIGKDQGFAKARETEIEEYLYKLA